MILALSGYARSGKDTAAAGLTEIGFKRVAFADKLREFLYALNPVVVSNAEFGQALEEVTYARLADVIDERGWDGYKEGYYGQEIRQLLQRLGTECGRQIISDTVWIDAALNGAEGNICVTDCRFLNESEAIRRRGGYVVRINRPGVGPANNHISETSLDNYDFDATIDNDGTVEELWRKIQKFANEVVKSNA